MTKMKPQGWDSLPRQSKLAACMYPDLVPKDIQQEMTALARNERKFSPLEGKLNSEKARRDQASGRATKPEAPKYVSPRWWNEK